MSGSAKHKTVYFSNAIFQTYLDKISTIVIVFSSLERKRPSSGLVVRGHTRHQSVQFKMYLCAVESKKPQRHNQILNATTRIPYNQNKLIEEKRSAGIQTSKITDNRCPRRSGDLMIESIQWQKGYRDGQF